MRNLFLFLLAANLCYFFWKITTEVAPAPKNSGLALEELKILSVTKEPVKIVVRPVSSKVDAEVAIKMCYMVGDFKTNLLAEKAMEDLVAVFPVTQATIKVVKGSGLVRDYWIIYPAEDSWEKSKLNVEIIRKKGIKDLWLVPNGKDKGVISLGLFKNQKQALSRANRLKAKGLDVEIIARNVEKSVYRILFEVLVMKKVVESLINYKFDTKEIRIEEISC